MKISFIIGTPEYEGVKQGSAISDRTHALLDKVCRANDIDGDVVMVFDDPRLAGKAKAKLGMAAIKEQRPKVLQEALASKPDAIVCLGPVATACIFNKGNLKESDMLRQEHAPLGENQPPVHVTFGLENLAWKDGMGRWLEMDIAAVAQGHTETEWGEYVYVLPGSTEWRDGPRGRNYDVGFDLETYPGTDPWHPDARIRMAVVAFQNAKTWVVQTDNGDLPLWLQRMTADPKITKAGSNIKFDYVWMRRFGYDIQNMWDTSTHEHIIDETNPKKDLKSLTFKYLPRLGDYSRGHRDRVRELGGWEYMKDEEMYQYAGGDGEASLAAYLAQLEIIKKMGLERPARLFRDLYAVLADMEHRGACVDMGVNQTLDTLYEQALSSLRQEITVVLGPININSNTQLAEALAAAVPNINLTTWKKILADEDEVTTKKEVLERESDKHPVIKKVLKYRSLRTRHSTFIKGVREKHAVPKLGRHFIHPNFNTSVVETYRLSSSRPNGQNFPRKDNDDPALTVKKQFVSRWPGGEILDADQSQIEIRIAAQLSGDEKMLLAIASGEDIHTAMAALMLGKNSEDVTEQERQECKTRTFLILYGGGAGKLARDLKISQRRAQQLINQYFEAFSGLKVYIDKVHKEVEANREVETLFGFKRRFRQPGHWNSPDGWRIKRQSFNTLVQNAAACVTYCSMIWLHARMKEAGLRSLMFLQVHDSILIDVYPGEREQVAALVRESMENAREITKTYGADITVPLHCDIQVGPSWGDVKPLEN